MHVSFKRSLGGIVLALAPAWATAEDAAPAMLPPTGQGDSALQASELLGAGALDFQDEEDAALVAPDASLYQFYIADLESRHGAYAQGLSEQLDGLGRVYQEQGLHQEAIKIYKRAVHLARVNNGLYSQQQIPLLQRLITSYVATGEYGKADERQYYLYRVQRRINKGNALGMSEVMLERAEWQRTAYFLSVGDTSYARLLSMWELYGAALREIVGNEGTTSENLIRPLKGMLQTQYLIASYEGESAPQFSINASGAEQGTAEENRFALIRMSNYRQGLQVINSLREVYTANEAENSPLAATTTIMQGDWSMRYQKQDTAMRLYRAAWEELAAVDNGEAMRAMHFGQPVMLPALVGISADEDLKTPPKLHGYATVSFGVSQRGRVVDLNLVEKQPVVEGDDKTATRLLRRLRAKTFRPRLEAGEAVATENIVRQYAY